MTHHNNIDVPQDFYEMLWRLIDEHSEWLADHVPGKDPSPKDLETYNATMHTREGLLLVLCELTGVDLVGATHHATSRILNRRRTERAA